MNEDTIKNLSFNYGITLNSEQIRQLIKIMRDFSHKSDVDAEDVASELQAFMESNNVDPVASAKFITPLVMETFQEMPQMATAINNRFMELNKTGKSTALKIASDASSMIGTMAMAFAKNPLREFVNFGIDSLTNKPGERSKGLLKNAFNNQAKTLVNGLVGATIENEVSAQAQVNPLINSDPVQKSNFEKLVDFKFEVPSYDKKEDKKSKDIAVEVVKVLNGKKSNIISKDNIFEYVDESLCISSPAFADECTFDKINTLLVHGLPANADENLKEYALSYVKKRMNFAPDGKSFATVTGLEYFKKNDKIENIKTGKGNQQQWNERSIPGDRGFYVSTALFEYNETLQKFTMSGPEDTKQRTVSTSKVIFDVFSDNRKLAESAIGWLEVDPDVAFTSTLEYLNKTSDITEGELDVLEYIVKNSGIDQKKRITRTSVRQEKVTIDQIDDDLVEASETILNDAPEEEIENSVKSDTGVSAEELVKRIEEEKKKGSGPGKAIKRALIAVGAATVTVLTLGLCNFAFWAKSPGAIVAANAKTNITKRKANDFASEHGLHSQADQNVKAFETRYGASFDKFYDAIHSGANAAQIAANVSAAVTEFEDTFRSQHDPDAQRALIDGAIEAADNSTELLEYAQDINSVGGVAPMIENFKLKKNIESAARSEGFMLDDKKD